MAQQADGRAHQDEVLADRFYCSTSGTTFTERDELTSHYRSELHRYNLKRKVAGLPPVTAEWFEARRDQLASIHSQAQAEAQQVYVCPLTAKRFQSEGTYESHTRTKKFQAAMKQAGLKEAPPPKVQAKPVPAPPGSAAPAAGAHASMAADECPDSDWETDSEDGMQEDGGSAAAGVGAARSRTTSGVASAEEQWDAWDPRRCLFDNHASASLEANLRYMYKRFGFALPDPEYLADAEGLLQYLGAKLQYGHVPLYSRGDDAGAKQFGSLHAVQRHMVDSGRCQLLYDGNEEEYEEFYDYGDMDSDDEQQLALAGGAEVTPASELVVSRGPDTASVLGSRAFRHLYKQRLRPVPAQHTAAGHSHLMARVPAGQAPQRGQAVAAYRQLGVPQVTAAELAQRKHRRKLDKRRDWGRLKSEMANDKIYNLPKNVTY